MNPTEIRVAVAGGEIVGHVWGHGDREVILVPSIGGSESYWSHTARLLGEVATVATFSLRGHGRSTCEVGGRSGDVLRDIVHVADHLGMDRPALVGKEFGGGVAALCAALFPTRFGALGLFDSPMILPSAEYAELLEIFDVPDHMDGLVRRLGLGFSGENQASLASFLDTHAQRLAADWMARPRTIEDARAALLSDTLVHPNGAWQHRPTGDTCRRLATLPANSFARPGRELLAELTIPVWVLQPLFGHYAETFPEFRAFARAYGRDWQLVDIDGGIDVLYDDVPAEILVELLETLPRRSGDLVPS